MAASRPHQGRYLVTFEGVVDRAGADALRGLELRARPVEVPGVLWVHELVGSEVVSTDGQVLGTVAAVEANPASDLLVLSGGGLVPLRFVTDHQAGVRVTVDVPDGLLDTAGAEHRRGPGRRARTGPATDRSGRRPCASTSSPSSPTWSRATARPALLGRAREQGLARPARPRPALGAPRTPGARWTTRPSAGEPGWCSCPSPCSARSRRWRRPRGCPARCSCSVPGGRRFDQAAARELSAGDGVLAALRPLRGRRPAGGRPPGRRRAVGGRRRAGRRRGRRPGGRRGGDPAPARRAGERRPRRPTRASPTGCWSTPSTPGRPGSGAGRSPRSCVRGTTARSPAGAGPRRCAARWPTDRTWWRPGAA